MKSLGGYTKFIRSYSGGFKNVQGWVCTKWKGSYNIIW